MKNTQHIFIHKNLCTLKNYSFIETLFKKKKIIKKNSKKLKILRILCFE